MVGRVGAALEDKQEYQQVLSEGRMRRVEGSSDQLHEVRHGSLCMTMLLVMVATTSHSNKYSWREPERLSND